ncbi:MAG: hypothetical protein JWN00_166 [Actinomycetia bacterium]|nr:hypothetical protein [Actinomycetes bacterium]
MARRPAVDNGSDTAASDVRDPWEPPPTASGMTGTGRRGRWGGSGGRWAIWIGRIILWALILVILVNGIRAPFERFTTPSSTAPQTVQSQSGGAQFPVGPASAYALQFANVYLNYDQANPGDRDHQLQYFLPDSVDSRAGWNGAGQLSVQLIQVAGVDAKDVHNAVVTLLVKTSGTWLQLAVPVYASGGQMAISGLPALLPAPQRAAPPQTAIQDRDTDLETALKPTLEGFFRAYSSGDTVNLNRFSANSFIAGLPQGTVVFVALGDVIAPRGGTDQRTLTAAVTWSVPSPTGKAAGQLNQTYQLTVVKKDGNWYVRDLRGATP